MLTPPLDWLDRALTPENVEDHPKPHPGKKLRMNVVWLSTPRTPNRELAEKAGRSEFGWPVFDFALKLAIAYPILFLILSWAVLGGAGKIGDVKAMWPALATVVQWIREAGGVAVLAHPLHYKLTATKLRALIADFAAAGGEAMEVSNGRPSNDELSYARRLCKQFGLEASVGSDFHRPTPWSELGCDVALAGDCPPVWRRWLKP